VRSRLATADFGLLLLALLVVCGEIPAGQSIDATGTASGKWQGPVGGPSEAVNGAGLAAGRHGAAIAHNWMQTGAGGGNGAWFLFDLEGRCDLKALVFWNYFELRAAVT